MTILFIDDDPDDTDLFCEAVAFLNDTELLPEDKDTIDCIVANNGCTAIELMPTLKLPPDYIFLDINMPLMDGKACLEYLKSQPGYAQIPVVMLSTRCNEHDIRDFKALGAIDCIPKPNGFNDLVKALSKYVFQDRI